MIERLPLVLLTGFLGSGKTTLLQHFLENPAFTDTAVIVNEFGEIGLDHQLIEFSSEQTVVLPGGCVCCAVRDDLEVALRRLFSMRDCGTIPAFKRILIETTGLAAPAPIIATLQKNPLAKERLRFAGTITVVDTVLGRQSLSDHPEAQQQVAIADWLVLSKCDLANSEDIQQSVVEITRINPWAITLRSDDDTALTELAARIIGDDKEETDRMPSAGRDDGDLAGPGLPHDTSQYMAFSLVHENAMNWTAFGIWLSMMVHKHGARMLRVKGLLNVSGLDGPVLIPSVQHAVYPPRHLARWPSSDTRTRIAIIAHGLDPRLVERSLNAFLRLDECAATIRRGSQYKMAGAGGTVRGRPVRRPTAPRWLGG